MSKKSILFFKKQDNDIDFSNFSLIIPVDYESAIHLDSLKINYVLPENYVSLKEYFEIDKLAIKLGKSLWDVENEDSIKFKKINIPKLFRLEDTINLFRLLKKIFEYKKIFEKELPDEVISSVEGNVFDDVPKFLSSDQKIKYGSLYIEKKSIAHFDNVPIQMKIGGKIFSINQKQFKKIKKFSESIVKKLPQKHLGKNPLLLIDFNPVLYEYFFDYLEKEGIEFVLLNSRKPVVWNKKSLKIQLSKKYNIDYLSNYHDKESENTIQFQYELIQKNFLSILENNSFKSKLTVENLNFSELLKNEFKNYFPQKIFDSVKNIELSSKLLKQDFSHILVWAYQLPFEKIILNLATHVNIPVGVLQDGLKGRLSEPHLGIIENYNDYDYYFKEFFVWGKMPCNYYLNSGIPKNKILLSGSPLYDSHFQFKQNQKLTNTILLATSGLGLSLDANTVSRTKKYQSYIELICRTIPNLNRKKLAIKLHPFSDERIDIPNIAKNIDSNIELYKYENIVDLISNSDLIISKYSTVILESMILGKPTMIWLDDDFHESVDLPFIKSGASLKLDENNLEKQIHDFYKNPSIRKNLLENSQYFLNDYLENHGTSSNFIANFLKNN